MFTFQVLVILILLRSLLALNCHHDHVDGLIMDGDKLIVISDNQVFEVNDFLTKNPKSRVSRFEKISPNFEKSGFPPISSAFLFDEVKYIISGDLNVINIETGTELSFDFIFKIKDLTVDKIEGSTYHEVAGISRFMLSGTNSSSGSKDSFQVVFERSTDKPFNTKLLSAYLVINQNDHHQEIESLGGKKLIVVYGKKSWNQFYAIQEVDPLNSKISFDQSRYHYQQVGDLIGCPRELCIDGQIDSVIRKDGKLIITSNDHFYRLPKFSPRSEFSEIKKLTLIPDAVFQLGGSYYEIMNDKIKPRINFEDKIDKIFPKLSLKDKITAVMFKHQQLFIFVQKFIYLYNVSPKYDKFDFVDKYLITDKWNLPNWTRIDTIFYDEQENVTLIMKGDFHLRFNGDSRNSTTAQGIVNQNTLWFCSDPNFSEKLTQVFDVANYQQFLSKIIPHRRRLLIEEDKKYDQENSGKQTNPKKKKDSKSNKILNVFLIVIFLLLFVVIIAVCVHFIRKSNVKKDGQVDMKDGQGDNKKDQDNKDQEVKEEKGGKGGVSQVPLKV